MIDEQINIYEAKWGNVEDKKKVYKGVQVMVMVIPEQKDFVYN